jgi:hypothetical protein
MSDITFDQDIAQMVQDLENNVADNLHVKELSNHVIQAPSVFNIIRPHKMVQLQLTHLTQAQNEVLNSTHLTSR